MAKFRSSFVTNSSSSSFVIYMKDQPNIPEEILTQFPFLRNYMKVIKNALDGDEIITGDNFDEWFKDYAMIDSLELMDKWDQQHYNKYKEKIDKGYLIIKKSIDYHEEQLQELLHSLDDGENIIVEEEN